MTPICPGISRAAWLAAALLIGSSFHAPAAPVQVSKVTDVLDVWSPSNRVYVKGEVGMSPEALNNLDQWVLKNAPNWTIVLADTVKGERYRAADGRELADLTAIEYALGQGLPNRTGHGELKDSRTGERNGAVFTIVTKDRNITYSSSEEQDRRGVGKSAWKNNLDRPAIESLRNGMRISEAVEKTVTQIEGRITSSIEQAERSRRESAARAEKERRDRIAEAKTQIDATRRQLAELTHAVKAFRKDYPEAQGDIANPPSGEYEAKLAALAQSAETDPQKAIQEAGSLKSEIASRMRLLREYPAASEQLRFLRERIEPLAASPLTNQVREHISLLETSLFEAANLYEHGDSRYAERLAALTEETRQVEQWHSFAAAEAKRQSELQFFLSLALVAVAILMLVVLHLRRRGEKQAALKLLKEWRALLAAKTDALLALLGDARVTVGSVVDAEERFAGQTLARAKETIRNVDELFILSSHLREIVDQAERIALPKGLGLLLNLFAKFPYKRVRALLTSSKIAFDPKTPLKRLAVKEGSADELLGRIEDYQPFEISLNSLVEIFNARASDARSGLDEISAAWPAVDALRGEIESAVERLKAVDPNLLPALQSALIPETERRFEEAMLLSIKDALAGLPPLREIQRMVRQGEAAGELVRESSEEQNLISRSAAALRTAAIPEIWIGRLRDELHSRTNEVMAQCAQQDVAEGLESLREDRQAWLNKVAEAETATERIVALEKTIPELETAFPLEQIKLSDALGAGGVQRTSETLFAEPGFEVLAKYKDALLQIATARGVLSNGDSGAALSALGRADGFLAAAAGIISRSLDIANRFREVFSGLTETRRRLREEAAQAAASLAKMKAGYTESALQIPADVASAAETNFTVSDNVEEISGFDRQAAGALEAAKRALAAGHPIHAGQSLGAAEEALRLVKNRIDEIDSKKRELEAVQAAAREIFSVLQEDEAKLKERMDAFATREINRQAAGLLLPRIEAAEGLLSSVPQDPFALRTELADLAVAVSKVKTDFKNDPDLLQCAEAALSGTLGQLDAAQQLSRTQLHSSVAPSARMRDAKEEVARIAQQAGQLQQSIRTPHFDWAAIYEQATALAARLSSCSAELRGELAAANRAIESLRRANREVGRAAGWSGRHGIRVRGTPGKRQMSSAEALLLSGQYELAFAAAEQAIRVAEVSIAEAEALVLQKDREEREAEEARRSSWNSDSGSSHSSFDSGSSSSSFSSSDSGSSSSSFSSSDSGSSSSSF